MLVEEDKWQQISLVLTFIVWEKVLIEFDVIFKLFFYFLSTTSQPFRRTILGPIFGYRITVKVGRESSIRHDSSRLLFEHILMSQPQV